MGDSFTFFTLEDTVTPSNSSGYNGFPFPYKPNGVSGPFVIGRRFPVAVPLDDCGVLYWKGKNYSVSTDISATYNSITLAYPNGAMTPESGNATREYDLAQGTRHGWNFGAFVLYDTSSGSPIILDSGSVYPYLYISSTLTPDPSGLTPPTLSISSDSGDFTPDTSIPVTIIGGSLEVTINLTLYLKNNGLDSFTGTHFDLTIIDEWTY